MLLFCMQALNQIWHMYLHKNRSIVNSLICLCIVQVFLGFNHLCSRNRFLFLLIPIAGRRWWNCLLDFLDYSMDCCIPDFWDHQIWEDFLQGDIQCHTSPKSSWSTAGVVSILWQLHSNHTVYCHMGQTGTAWRRIRGIHHCLSVTIF